MLLTFLKRIFIDKSLGMGTFSTSMEPYINLLKVIIFIEEGILIVKSLMLICPHIHTCKLWCILVSLFPEEIGVGRKFSVNLPHFILIAKNFFNFPQNLTEFSNIFCQNIKIQLKRATLFNKSYRKFSLGSCISQTLL